MAGSRSTEAAGRILRLERPPRRSAPPAARAAAATLELKITHGLKSSYLWLSPLVMSKTKGQTFRYRFGNLTKTFWYRSRISLIENRLFRFGPESALLGQIERISFDMTNSGMNSFVICFIPIRYWNVLWNVCSFTVLILLIRASLNVIRKRLDRGHVHPRLEVPGLTCPSRESNPRPHGGGRRALKKRVIRTVYLMAIRNIYK